ncbi:hypothetical protein CSA56_09905 [candidate division KSB3 bacterium]|uniref:Uncharacterized protein n=1 Tax=candidate division KSB3 bacterium TaxID=2044937 RepID=A0A2G6KDU2_9BACT|nr:MAG: hypothetical protein CSA56_09905 [candidate division KSB3 bacterium]
MDTYNPFTEYLYKCKGKKRKILDTNGTPRQTHSYRATFTATQGRKAVKKAMWKIFMVLHGPGRKSVHSYWSCGLTVLLSE